MEDQEIIELYWARSESAITETHQKYGNYCYRIAYQILASKEDSAECINDTYLNAWEHIPPQRPRKLNLYLGKITRNLSLNRYKHDQTLKRGGTQVQLALEELHDGILSSGKKNDLLDRLILTDVLNRFLGSLSVENRKIFMRRYWYFSSIKEIAKDYALTESKVKMSLLRSRNTLKQFLEKEECQNG